jgi:hypothetical protein
MLQLRPAPGRDTTVARLHLNAASLVRFAAARGIDLTHVAGASSNVDGIARERARTDVEIEIGIQVRETAKGRETRTYSHPAWTVAELGQAAGGLGPLPWAAALYSFAGSRDGYWMLWQALASEATRVARRECWPPRVTMECGEPRFYRDQLAELVLIEDANKQYFTAAPALYSACMAVTPPIWDRQLSDPFRSLRSAYDRWLGIARGAIGRSIRGET